jgi:hypothetical protein
MSEVQEEAAKISIEQDYGRKVIVQYTGPRQIEKKLRRKIIQIEQQTEMLKIPSRRRMRTNEKLILKLEMTTQTQSLGQ